MNLIFVGLYHVQKNISASAICVLDDPDVPKTLTVLPRRCNDVVQAQRSEAPWNLTASNLQDYAQDRAKVVRDAFALDWENSRLPLLISDSEAQQDVQKYFLEPDAEVGNMPRYLRVMLAWDQSAFALSSTHTDGPVGITLDGFIQLLETLQREAAASQRINSSTLFKAANASTIFSVAKMLDRNRTFKVMPKKGLARFQFLEAIVRLAVRRFRDQLGAVIPWPIFRKSVQEFFDCTHFGVGLAQFRATFHAEVFTEAVDVIFSEHLDVLHTVFEGYSKTDRRYPGAGFPIPLTGERSDGCVLSFTAWQRMLRSAKVIGFDKQEAGGVGIAAAAFALGKYIHADEVSNWRHMALSFSEFLAALVAVVRIPEDADYDPDFLPELLEEFLCANMEEARIGLRPGVDALLALHRPFGTVTDAEYAPLLQLMERVFTEANTTGGRQASGLTVSLREFQRCMRLPHVKSELTRLRLTNTEILVLLHHVEERSIERHHGGEVTMEDLCDGLIRVHSSLRGMDKAIAHLERAFVAADVDGSGALDIEELQNLLKESSLVRKLTTIGGMSVKDISGLFELFDEDNSGTVTMKEVVYGMMRLKDPNTVSNKGVRCLHKRFDLWHYDHKGHTVLGKKEFLELFDCPEIEKELVSHCLKVPDWQVLFEELDTDGSADLSWEEISEGMASYWATQELVTPAPAADEAAPSGARGAAPHLPTLTR